MTLGDALGGQRVLFSILLIKILWTKMLLRYRKNINISFHEAGKSDEWRQVFGQLSTHCQCFLDRCLQSIYLLIFSSNEKFSECFFPFSIVLYRTFKKYFKV